MQKIVIKQLTGILLILSVQTSISAPVEISSGLGSSGQILPSPPSSWTFSPAAVGGTNAYKTNLLTGHEGASATLSYISNALTGVVSVGSVAFNLPVKAMTYDSADQSLLSHELQGSIRIAGPLISNVFVTGGELTLSNIRIDHASKVIYATVRGANGVGTQENVAFWTYQSASGGRILSNGRIKVVLRKLQLTQSGFNSWSRSLGFQGNGPASLATINNSSGAWGSMTLTANVTGIPNLPNDPICAIP